MEDSGPRPNSVVKRSVPGASRADVLGWDWKAGDATMFYDGSCGFCARSVQFVLTHERDHRSLRFATLAGSRGRAIRATHTDAAVDSVYLVLTSRSGRQRLLVQSDAALAIAAYMGGPWRLLAAIGLLLPRFIRDGVYSTVARHRHKLSLSTSCLVPSPAQRERFSRD